MPKEIRERAFNKMMLRMNSIELVDGITETRLRIAFQEGLICAQEYLIKKIEPHVKNLEDYLLKSLE